MFRRVLFMLVLLAIPAGAQAGWFFSRYTTDGWYLRVNDAGQNDGYGYYIATSYTPGCYCVGSSYFVNGGPLPAAAYSTSVTYSKDWPVVLAEKATVLKDHQLFAKTARDLGFQVDPIEGGGAQSAAQPYGYASQGSTTYNTGYGIINPQGSTLWTAAVSPGQYGTDIAAANHEFQRGADAWRDTAGQIYNQLGMLNAQRADSVAKIAMYQAAAKANSDVFASMQSQTVTKTEWNTQPQVPFDPNQPQPNAQPVVNPTPVNPQAIAPADHQSFASPEFGARIVQSSCIRCHGASSTGPDFTPAALAAMNGDMRIKLGQRAHDAIMSGRMPKGGQRMGEESANSVKAYFVSFAPPEKPIIQPTPPLQQPQPAKPVVVDPAKPVVPVNPVPAK